MIALITMKEEFDIYGEKVDVLEQNYIDFFNGFGIYTFPISNKNNINETFKYINPKLVIFSGGGDIKKFDVKNIQLHRNVIETDIIEIALKEKIPIIGICRGMQFINNYFGGNIKELKELTTRRPIGQEHVVELFKKVFKVNNFHNYGVYKEDLCSDFTPLVIDKENKIIEAFYSKNLKILGIQWHPERKFSSLKDYNISRSIIQNFIEKEGIINESDYFSCR